MKNMMNLKKLETVTSPEFVNQIKMELKKGGELLSVRETEYYVYVDLFEGCFEHYVFDLDTKKYTVAYLSFSDIHIFVEFMKKEGVA